MHQAVMARQQRVRLAPDCAAWTGFSGWEHNRYAV